VDDVEGARVSLDVLNDTDTASVSSLGDHALVSDLEGHDIQDLAGGDVNLDDVVSLDKGIRVADGAAVVSDHVGDLLLGQLNLLDSAQLEGLLLVTDSVKSVSALGIEDQSELVAGLGDLNDVHEASREVGVGSDATINLDVLLHADHLGFLASQSILKSVAKDQDEGKGLSQGVRSLGWARSLLSGQTNQSANSPTTKIYFNTV
jgi:hypothetical protein